MEGFNKYVNNKTLLSVLAGATVASSNAFAQREVATGLEEIVVTAQKREESIQDVPLAVTALSAEALEKTFARDLLDVTGAAPNLIIDPILGNGTAAIAIRGMQLNDVEKSFDPAVAVYMDGIYLTNTTGALLQVWDSEGVEVLRGPQGTLFGRNTIGGLVHIKRKAPTGKLGGRLTATYGSFDRTDLNAAINFPALADGALKLKATAMYRDGGGYFDNSVRGEQEGDTEYVGFIGMALWEPNDSFSLQLSYDIFRDDTETRPVTSLTQAGESFNANCVNFAPLCGQPPQNADFHRKPSTTLHQDAFVDTDALTINAQWDLNDNHSLYAVFGVRDVEDDAVQEFDGIGSTAAAFPLNGDFFHTQRPTESEQSSLELRWHTSLAEGAVQTVAGVFLMDSEYSISQSTFSFAFFGIPTNPGDVVFSNPGFIQETATQAIFAQLDWNVTERLALSLGARYIDEEKEACGVQSLELLGAGRVNTAVYGSTNFDLCDANDPSYTPFGTDPITGVQVPRTGRQSWTEVTPRVALSYRFDQAMVYASYTEGFRSGGFNGRSTTAFTLGPYEPESVESFELGARSQWLDNRLQINATAFFTDYQEKQEDVVFPDPVAVTQTIVQNAADATINGLELELVAIPADGLTLTASYGYMDASYDAWNVADPFDSTATNIINVDQSSFELRRAPDNTLSLGVLYEHTLANNNFLVFKADYLRRDDYWVIARTNNTQPGSPGRNDAYGILDASISYETENWRLSLFGKNLTNDDYFLHALDVGANVVATSATDSTPVYVPGLWTFGTINADRTWGIELDHKF